jgi:RNA polymerase sigma factor (sigma-70 family)
MEKKMIGSKNDILNKYKKLDDELVDDQYYYDENFDDFKLTEEVNNVLSTLSSREKQVIKYRYYENMTFEEIGKSILNMNSGKYGICSQNVSHILGRAIHKIRHNRRSRKLIQFLIR